jgi:hypothetical protein
MSYVHCSVVIGVLTSCLVCFMLTEHGNCLTNTFNGSFVKLATTGLLRAFSSSLLGSYLW